MAPEYDWDDYKGTNLKGKVALLFVNQPASDDPKFFKGKALTYYGTWTYKFEETARRRAIATLMIHRTDLANHGWEVVRNSWGSSLPEEWCHTEITSGIVDTVRSGQETRCHGRVGSEQAI